MRVVCLVGYFKDKLGLETKRECFLVCKNHWILSISGRFLLLWPGFVTNKHSRLLLSLMSCEYLALGACSTSFVNSEHVSGPHAVLVVDEQNNKPETGPTHFPA